MKKIFTILILSSLFAGELEVEGDLKVTGNIDAQNNPIKNVGIPQELTDAINGNILQDALRDDTIYEYMFLYLRFAGSSNWNMDNRQVSYLVTSDSDGDIPWSDGGIQALNNYITSGWYISHRINIPHSSSYNFAIYELKRPIEE